MTSLLESSVTATLAIANAPTTRNCEFRPSDETRAQLYRYWNRCCHGNDEWFQRLWDMHTNYTRHYHTAVHLLEMCNLLDIVMETTSGSSEKQVLDRKSILLAIFFHDAVYDATSSTNEEDSAKLYLEFDKSVSVDTALATKVYDWIIATKTHQASVAAANDPSLQLFLDLDMAVLGKTAPAYLEYARLIRCEYQFVPKDTYCDKRSIVLQSFLQQDKIYGNPQMREALEQRARDNLRSEIRLLRRGIIPGMANNTADTTVQSP